MAASRPRRRPQRKDRQKPDQGEDVRNGKGRGHLYRAGGGGGGGVQITSLIMGFSDWTSFYTGLQRRKPNKDENHAPNDASDFINFNINRAYQCKLQWRIQGGQPPPPRGFFVLVSIWKFPWTWTLPPPPWRIPAQTPPPPRRIPRSAPELCKKHN